MPCCERRPVTAAAMAVSDTAPLIDERRPADRHDRHDRRRRRADRRHSRHELRHGRGQKAAAAAAGVGQGVAHRTGVRSGPESESDAPAEI